MFIILAGVKSSNKYLLMPTREPGLVPVLRTPDFDFMEEKLNAPVIFDGRNFYDFYRRKNYRGFYYKSIVHKEIS